MKLDEAKVILEENGYELLEEGKLGRALGIGALALGSLVGNANADWTDDFENEVKQTEQKYIKTFEDEAGYIHYLEDLGNRNYKIYEYNGRGDLVSVSETKDFAVNAKDKNWFGVWTGKTTNFHELIDKGEISSVMFFKNGDITKNIIYKDGEPAQVALYKNGKVTDLKCRDGRTYKGKTAQEVSKNFYYDKEELKELDPHYTKSHAKCE